MTRALLALSLLSFAACHGGDVDPRSGTWDFIEGEWVENSCGAVLDLSSGEFELTAHGDGTFTIDTPEVTEPFACEVDGDAFTCPDRLLRVNLVGGAVIEVRSRDVGAFSSSTAASGVRSADVTCTGSQCEAAAAIFGGALPCSGALEFTVELRS